MTAAFLLLGDTEIIVFYFLFFFLDIMLYAFHFELQSAGEQILLNSSTTVIFPFNASGRDL